MMAATPVLCPAWPSDETVKLGKSRPLAGRPDHPVWLIRVEVKPYESHRGMKRPRCDGTLRIVTNRLDLPAELLAEISRQRWGIEMFFRLFKHIPGCRHLISDKHNGVEIQAGGGEHVTTGEPMRVAAAILHSPCRTPLPFMAPTSLPALRPAVAPPGSRYRARCGVVRPSRRMHPRGVARAVEPALFASEGQDGEAQAG